MSTNRNKTSSTFMPVKKADIPFSPLLEEEAPQHRPILYNTVEIDMPQAIIDNVDKIFGDHIALTDTIDFPFITPNGKTHHFNSIKESLKIKPEDPFTRESLHESQLVLSVLYLRLKEVFFDGKTGNLKTKLNLVELREVLTCPLSKQLFQNPVVATNGITYEEDYLIAYLNLNNNYIHHPASPSLKLKQHVKNLYPNRVVKDLLEIIDINALLLENPAITNQECRAKYQPYLKSIRNYTRQRSGGPLYTGLPVIFFDKEKKVTTALELAQQVNKFQPNITVGYAGQQGKLGGIFKKMKNNDGPKTGPEEKSEKTVPICVK